MEKGLIHIYCGDGKGKTTAAVGLCVRACGCGKKVLLAQFLKDDSSGELVSLGLLPGFSRIPAPKRVKFTFQMNEEERRESAKRCAQMLQDARRAAEAGACDLLVLDECFGALSTGMLNMEALLDFVEHILPAPAPPRPFPPGQRRGDARGRDGRTGGLRVQDRVRPVRWTLGMANNTPAVQSCVTSIPLRRRR